MLDLQRVIRFQKTKEYIHKYSTVVNLIANKPEWQTQKVGHLLKEGVLFQEWKVKMKVAQSCLTLCDPMDYIVHGILQVRIWEWVAFPFSRGSSQSRDQIQVSCIAGSFFTSWATREAQTYWSG